MVSQQVIVVLFAALAGFVAADDSYSSYPDRPFPYPFPRPRPLPRPCPAELCPAIFIRPECRLRNYNIDRTTGRICESCPIDRCRIQPCPSLLPCQYVPEGCARYNVVGSCYTCPVNLCRRRCFGRFCY